MKGLTSEQDYEALKEETAEEVAAGLLSGHTFTRLGARGRMGPSHAAPAALAGGRRWP